MEIGYSRGQYGRAATDWYHLYSCWGPACGHDRGGRCHGERRAVVCVYVESKADMPPASAAQAADWPRLAGASLGRAQPVEHDLALAERQRPQPGEGQLWASWSPSLIHLRLFDIHTVLYRYACIGIETLQRAPPPPRSSSDSHCELASLADKDSHAEAAGEGGGAGEAGEAGVAGAAGAASAQDQGELCDSLPTSKELAPAAGSTAC